MSETAVPARHPELDLLLAGQWLTAPLDAIGTASLAGLLGGELPPEVAAELEGLAASGASEIRLRVQTSTPSLIVVLWKRSDGEGEDADGWPTDGIAIEHFRGYSVVKTENLDTASRRFTSTYWVRNPAVEGWTSILQVTCYGDEGESELEFFDVVAGRLLWSSPTVTEPVRLSELSG